MHSSTSAPAHSCCARASASAGSSSPNSTTSGLSGSPQALAARHAVGVGGEQRTGALERDAAVAAQARARGDAAVDLHQLACAGLAMEHVDVLGDHRVQQPLALHRHERVVGVVGQLAAERGEALAVEAPEARGVGCERRRCARPPSGRRSATGRVPGERKSGIPEGTEMPAPVNATTDRAERISSAR